MKTPKIIATIVALMISFSIAAQQPNIVFIMTDDVGYGDIGSYGAPDIKTPNIDQLAKDGVKFTDFYANGPVCTPTRAGFITGRYQQRYALERPLRNSADSEGTGLPADGNSVPQLLKNAGYQTALIGKWHLGYEAKQSPQAHGFDYFFGFKSGYVDYYQHTNGSGVDDLWENDQLVNEEGYLTELIAARSVKYIQQHRDQTFFLSVQFNAAHWPYQPPHRPSTARDNAKHFMPYEDDPGKREDYNAMLESADQGIGLIIKALADNQLTENTLVIFTNDNGGEWMSRNAPLFNRKWTIWEGGIRVPAIVKWPEIIPANKITAQVGITMDFSASILAAAGATIPDNYEGINLLPILSDKVPVQERTLFWRANENRAVRKGDMKLVLEGDLHPFIFNVRTDLGERDDLVNREQAKAKELKALLDAWEADVNAEAEKRANKTTE